MHPSLNLSSKEDENLERFLQEFEETINKYSYAEYDKLILLKQQLSSSALILVNSLEADKQGYTHAKSLLLSALASSDSRKFSVIKQLTEISITAWKYINFISRTSVPPLRGRGPNLT